MKDIITYILFGLAFTVLAVILISFLRAVLRAKKKRRILSDFSPEKRSVVKLFKLTFGRKNVLRNVYIPKLDENNKKTAYVFADAVVITPKKIAVCNIRNEAGLIYCDEGFDWHQIARLRSGGTVESDFSDPTKMNLEAVRAIRRLFDNAMIEPPPIEGYVIFAPQSVRFSSARANVYKLADGYKAMKKAPLFRRIPKQSKKTFRKLILTSSASKTKAERFNIKKLTEIT